MARIWHSNRRDQKDLLRRARKGDTYYGTEHMSQRLAPFEDATLTGRWTVTHMNGILGGPMCGSMSLEQVLHEHGPLTDEQPKGRRGIWEPVPQVSGPLGDDTERYLDEPEIKGMKKLADEAKDRRRKSKSGRKGWL